MWYHGCYFRKADRNQSSGTSLNPVPVRRYYCPGCCRTCSRLPLCIAPRRWYDWSVQHRALYNLVCGHSVRSTSCNTGLARRTVRRWRDWLHDRNEAFSFFLRSRFPELGRTVDAAAFWRKVMEEMSLGLAMAWLDRALEIP